MNSTVRYILKRVTQSGKYEYVKELGRQEVFSQSIDNAQRYTKEEVIAVISKKPELIVVEEIKSYRDVVIKITVDYVEPLDTLSIKNEDERCWMN